MKIPYDLHRFAALRKRDNRWYLAFEQGTLCVGLDVQED